MRRLALPSPRAIPRAWRIGAAIGAIFAVAGVGYWFLSGYLDPAGTVLLVFIGGAVAVGFSALMTMATDPADR